MESEFKPSRQTEIPDTETLQNLLARLNDIDDWNPITRSEKVTVEDVAEALHLDPEFVAQELEALHKEHREARLAGVIRELEEPLYRVERTGHAPIDPLGNPLFKLRSVQILVEKNKVKPFLPRREQKMDRSERIGQVLGHMTLILMFALILVLVARVAIGAVMGR